MFSLAFKETWELRDIDPLDLEDIVGQIAKSFGLRFELTDFAEVKTFGQLCEVVAMKIELDDREDCTTQQAFYKLRNAIENASTNRTEVTPTSQLKDIIPRKGRRRKVRQIEKELGFQLGILSLPVWVSMLFLLAVLVSLATLFFDWKSGLAGFLCSVSAWRIAFPFRKEFDVKTVGEVVKKMSTENYTAVRRNRGTVNRKEVAEVIKDIFSCDGLLDKSKLTPDATFR